MRIRRPHILRRPRGHVIPTKIVCIAHETDCEVSGTEAVASTYTVAAAAIGVYRYEGGKFTRESITPYLGSDLRGKLHAMCRDGTKIWVFAPRLHQLLCGIDFFSAMDNERWYAFDGSARWREDAPANHGRTNTGYYCQETGCTILRVRRVRGGWLEAVDTHNYKVCVPTYGSDNITQQCRYIMDWSQKWIDFVSKAGLGSLQHTITGQAWYGFRQKYLQSDIMVTSHVTYTGDTYHDCDRLEWGKKCRWCQAIAMERASLYGGRCECRQLGVVRAMGLVGTEIGHYGNQVPLYGGHGPIYHLDVRSMYGSVARTLAVPIRIVDSGLEYQPTASTDWLRMVADVTLHLPEPIAPYRVRGSRIVCWPTGHVRTVLAGPELHACSAYITQVHRWVQYHCHRIFTTWADDCWRWRYNISHDPTHLMTASIKALGQVLYGRFGCRARGWHKTAAQPCSRTFDAWYQWDPIESRVVPYRSVAGRCERYYDCGETYDSCPAITAWVYAAARMRLLELIRRAGWSNVLYYDTDSLFVGEMGLDNLNDVDEMTGSGLGSLRLVDTYQSAEFCGLKHYIVDGRVVCAGYPPPQDAYAGVAWPYDHGEPLTLACAAERPPLAICRVDNRRLPRPYRHGMVHDDGRVAPWHFTL
jgi:hypothetical protein